MAFVAVTVKVYAVPFVSPVTVTGLAEPVAVIPPGLEVTVSCYSRSTITAWCCNVIVA